MKLEKEYTPFLTSDDLVNLDKFRLVIKLSIDLAQSQPFTAIGMKPTYQPFNLGNLVKDNSRKMYSLPRSEVEQKLNKWATQTYSKEGNLIQKN